METPATQAPAIKELLEAHATYKTGVTTALKYLTIDDFPPLSEDLRFLKNLTLDQTANSSCGITTYSLGDLE